MLTPLIPVFLLRLEENHEPPKSAPAWSHRVADPRFSGPSRFGRFPGHLEIGVAIHVNMADPLVVLKHRDPGVLHYKRIRPSPPLGIMRSILSSSFSISVTTSLSATGTTWPHRAEDRFGKGNRPSAGRWPGWILSFQNHPGGLRNCPI